MGNKKFFIKKKKKKSRKDSRHVTNQRVSEQNESKSKKELSRAQVPTEITSANFTSHNELKSVNSAEPVLKTAKEIKRYYQPTPVKVSDNNIVLVGQRKYRLVYDHRNGFNPTTLSERFSDILGAYEYVLGDWGYEQLRLRGFHSKDDKKSPMRLRINTLTDYLYEYCNFGCAFFILQRIGEVDHLAEEETTEADRKRYISKKHHHYNSRRTRSIGSTSMDHFPNAKSSEPVPYHSNRNFRIRSR